MTITCVSAPALPDLRPVRAENLIHGSDQHGCSPDRSTMMISGHVPAVRVPPDHAPSRGAAALPARGDMEYRRDLDPAPPTRHPAAAAAAPAEAEPGGPSTARGPAQRDTQGTPPEAAAAGHPGNDRALAPRHPPPPLPPRERPGPCPRPPPRPRGPPRPGPGGPGRPAPRRNIQALVRRLAREN